MVDPRNLYSEARAGNFSPAVADALPRVYVPDRISGDVTVIDPATLKVIGRFRVGVNPQHVVPSYDLKTLWVANNAEGRKDGSLTPIDPLTGTRILLSIFAAAVLGDVRGRFGQAVRGLRIVSDPTFDDPGPHGYLAKTAGPAVTSGKPPIFIAAGLLYPIALGVFHFNLQYVAGGLLGATAMSMRPS